MKARGEKKDGAPDCIGGADPRLGHVAPIRERKRRKEREVEERRKEWSGTQGLI